MTSVFSGPGRRLATAVVCLTVMVAGAGCTDGEDRPAPSSSPSPNSSTGTTATLEAKPVPMEVRVTKLHGRMPQAAQRTLEANIGRTVSAYFDDAFLVGPYPRTDFDGALATFSRGAAKQGRGDLDLLTNAELGPSVESVTPERKGAWLSVLAPNRVAAGVTAKIRLVYLADLSDAPDQRVTVSGRLLLTRKDAGGWEIFGYDVARSAVPVEEGADR